MRFEHILVTTDFSEDAKGAYEFASYQAKLENSRLTLLHIVPDWDVPYSLHEYIPDPAMIEKYRNSIREDALKRLEEIARNSFHSQKVQTAALLSSKPTAQAICDYAAEIKCNLIVMSAHGRGALSNLFLGSVMTRVLNAAPCPVFVIPRAAKANSR